jgi:hypothetical protein
MKGYCSWTSAQRVVGDPGAKLVFANPPLKTLAVRSGLAEYVDGYGSFHLPWAFFSEVELQDHGHVRIK